MRPDKRTPLSEAGRARREAMLGELIGAMDAHHRRRNARVMGGTFGFVALLAAVIVYVVVASGSGTSTAHVALAAHGPVTTAPVEPAVHIARIETDPSIVERYRAGGTNRVVVLDDRDLLQMLREIDRPAGLVRVNGDVWLTASVADDPTYDVGRPNSL